MNDDPREVLALLNSLGFIGIQAEQLKGFMKDLKLYRKVKDRERQQRKEEIKKKIIDKQRNMIKEILKEEKTEFHSVENTISTNSSSSYIDGSLIQVKVRCVSSDKENINIVNSEENYTRHNVYTTHIESRTTQDDKSCDNEDDKLYLANKSKRIRSLKKDFYPDKSNKIRAEQDKIVDQAKSSTLQSARPMSAPNILEHQGEHITSSQTKSTASTKYTGTKSFIRPWKLQQEAQKSSNVKKSDPVTLYQKYQQEWKHMSFPGEAKHSGIRWAIREKMLGADPHPMPLPRKSTSMPTLKRK